jgi:endonuclease/exonuclease/phosphatase (EEP) superfamily protein YafD
MRKNSGSSMKSRYDLCAALILLFCSLTLFLWQYLPPFSPILEIFLSSQTIQLFWGLFALIASLLLLFGGRKNKIPLGLSSLAAVVLIMNALKFAPEIKSCRPQYTQPNFSLYSHNVLFDGPVTPELVKIVRKLSPDVIALQEYNKAHIDLLHPLLLQLGYQAYINYEPPAEDAFALAIYSKLPVRNQRLVNMQGPYWKPVWPFQYCELFFDGKWIKISNVHLIPPQNPEKGLFPYPPQQKYVPGQIREILNTAGDGNSPAIILGDFNQTPTSKYLKGMEINFADSWAEAGCGLGFTWHNPFLFFRIDFILHTRHLRALHIETVKNEFSDHLGLYAVIAPN